jgi:hypothetical protein
MAIRRCPYCKAIIDESQKYCNNCGTQLLFPEDEEGEEPIKGEKILDEDFPGEPGASDSEEFIEELRDEADVDGEPVGDRVEIDLESVPDAPSDIPEKQNDEDRTFVDLREAEPEKSAPKTGPQDFVIEKPKTVAETSFPDIRVPEKPETDRIEIGEPEHPLSRRKKPAPEDELPEEILKPSETGLDAGAEIGPANKRRAREAAEKPAAPPPPPARNTAEDDFELSPPGADVAKSGLGRNEHDTKFEIARLIADFERRRRAHTAELEGAAAGGPAAHTTEAGNEPLEPPTEADIGKPPTSEDLAKEDEALRKGAMGDFATDYEYVTPGEPAAEEPVPADDHLPFLVGNLKKPDLEPEIPDESDLKAAEKHPVFTTEDLEETRPPEDLEERDRNIRDKRREFVSEDHSDESEAGQPAAVEPPPADEKSELISRILKKRAEGGGSSKESREVAESLAALKIAKPSERATSPEPEEIPELSKAEETVSPPADSSTFPAGDTIDFKNEVLEKSGAGFPIAPTMGIPETVTSIAPPLPFEAAVPEIKIEIEKEPEEIEEPTPAAPPATSPAAPPVASPVILQVEPEPEPEPEPERKKVVPEPIRKARRKVEEPVEKVEEPVETEPKAAVAAVPSPPSSEKPSVRAPVVRLGFFRRIRATIIDLLVVGVFWSGATALASRLMSVPVIDLIVSQVVPLAILFGVLLAVYFFMFFLFLGETPGGRLVMPKIRD